jgi:O-antigen/teichoic acid export membrane protein
MGDRLPSVLREDPTEVSRTHPGEVSAQPWLLPAQKKPSFTTEIGEISRQSGVVFAGTAFSAVVGYLFKIYLARTLGAEALGIYALGMTVVGFVGVFGGLGLTWAASRFPAEYLGAGRTEELRSFIAWGVLVLLTVDGALAGLVVLAGRWVSVRVYHAPALAHYLHLFAAMLVLGALTTFFAQLLCGYKNVATKTVITNFGAVSLTVVFTLILIALGTGLWGYIFAQVASSAVVLALLIWSVQKLTPPPARFALKKIAPPRRRIFSFATAAFAMDIVGFLYAQTDKVVLGFYLNPRAVGVYAVAATIVAFLAIALQSVNQIFAPTIADLHARGESALLHRLFQTTTKWITALTFPLVVAVMIFSRPLMRIFGPDFEPGWIILVVGAAGQLVNCATGSVGFLLLMSGNERRLVRIQLVMGVIAVSLCLLCVPRWGMAGAAVAAALASAGTNVSCLFEVRKRLGFLPYNRSYLRLALPSVATLTAAIAMRFALRPLGSDIVAVILTTVVSYVLFLGIALLFGLDAEDRLIASAVWYKVRSFRRRTQLAAA